MPSAAERELAQSVLSGVRRDEHHLAWSIQRAADTVNGGMDMRKILGRVLLTMVAVAWGTSAQATTITFDNTATATGTISYSGALGTPMTGAAITFDVITHGATELTCTGCVLTFTTGGSTAESSTDVDFAGGGTFTITGSVFDGIIPVAAGVLLTGSFVEANAREGASGTIRATGSGFDEKDPALHAFLGHVPGTYVYSTLNVSATGCDGNVENGFTCAVVEADVANDFVAVPEPASLSLTFLGAMLLAFALYMGRGQIV